MKKLSIITINYNNVEGLGKTIESVVSQTFTDFEFIVIDGGSTDGSVKVIKQHVDRIAYWVSEPDKGIYNAMNKGVLEAHGEYIQFLNSGDWLYSNKVLENIFLQNIETDIIYGNALGKTGTIENFPSILTAFFFYSSAICHQAVFHKRELFAEKQYDENYQFVSDWDFMLNAIVFENKTYFKVDYIVVGQQSGTSYSQVLADDERKSVLSTRFPQLIIQDFEILENIYNNPFFLYIEILTVNPKLRRFIKLIIRSFLVLTKQKAKIPRNQLLKS